MLRRLAILSLVLVVILAVVGLQISTLSAAPVEQNVAGAPNANLLPSDTAFYLDFRTNQISDVVKFLQDTSLKVTGNPMPDPFKDVDAHLSKMLGRTASWTKDIQPWLGDHFTLGLSLTDAQLDALKAGKQASHDFQAILAVKNSTRADAFFKELMSKADPSSAAVKTTTDTINGNPITVYTQAEDCGTDCMSLVQTRGYFAFGSGSGIDKMLDTLRTKKPTLAADANFGKIVRTLKPNNLVTVYLTPRLYALSLSAPSLFQDMSNSEKISDQTNIEVLAQPVGPQAIFDAINGQAFGLGRLGKVLYLDVVQSVNQDKLTSFYNSMNIPSSLLKLSNTPLSGAFTSQIPANAMFAIQNHGLGDVYDALKTAVESMPAMPPSSGGSAPDPKETFAQLEQGFKFLFRADLQKDLLTWMNGDYAFYVTYDADSTLAKLNPSQPMPFDFTLIAQTSDVAKTQDFVTKIEDALKLFGGAKVESAGTDLYTATLENGATFSYGLVNKTFFVTVGSGLKTTTDAIKGVKALNSSLVWVRARASTINPTTQLWYLNTNELSAAIKAMIPADMMNQKKTQQALAFIDLLNSATITGSPISKDGMSRMSIDLVMK